MPAFSLCFIGFVWLAILRSLTQSHIFWHSPWLATAFREMQIGQFSPEGVLMYVERGKLFKANRFSCIKKKTPDDFQRFHNIFFYKIFRFAVWTS